MGAAFDDEETLDETTECFYRTEFGPLRNIEDAQRLVTELQARLTRGRQLRPEAKHVLVARSAPGMPDEVNASLFPALSDAFDVVNVAAYPSWWAAELHLTEAPQSWAAALNDHASLTGVVTGTVDGGVLIDVGRPAFLPENQVDLLPLSDTSELVGRTLEVRVVAFDGREELVVSRRVILEERRDAKAQQTLPRLREGSTLTGTVSSQTDYGAFVDVGGVTGLIHVSDMGDRQPFTGLKIGDVVEVTVLEYRPEMQRLRLALRKSEC
ncbi:MAG: S1 RNA-binding domain-containing protein [Myxococcales bacterium]|nr:S1 RNA-binding domain-containing protein [Myxococcales bacterium]